MVPLFLLNIQIEFFFFSYQSMFRNNFILNLSSDFIEIALHTHKSEKLTEFLQVFPIKNQSIPPRCSCAVFTSQIQCRCTLNIYF